MKKTRKRTKMKNKGIPFGISFFYEVVLVKIGGKKIEGKFIKRPNRFEALVDIDGKIETVHVPNTGRMVELLHEGVGIILQKSDNPYRKTKYSLLHVYKKGHLICINSAFANRVFEEAVKKGQIEWLKGNIKREVLYSNSRFDFFIDGDVKYFIEVKCATYEENGIAMFPDAPTERGRRHIDELIEAKKNGFNAAVVIMIFMDYVTEFTPNYRIDRKFGLKLKNAYDNGVEVKAYRCAVFKDEVYIIDEVKIYF